jgi:hypothetical protein
LARDRSPTLTKLGPIEGEPRTKQAADTKFSWKDTEELISAWLETAEYENPVPNKTYVE